MAIAGYKLRLNGGLTTDQVTDVGNVFSYIFMGLEPSTEYTVEVASYDEFGEQSDWSAPRTTTTDAAPVMAIVIDENGDALIDENTIAVAVLV